MRLEPFGETHLEALTAMLGDPDILRFDREAGEIELGYLVAPAVRGRGVATAILQRMDATLWSRLPADP